MAAKPAMTAARSEPSNRMPERAPDGAMVIRNRLGEIIQLERLRDTADDPFNLERIGVYPPDGWVYAWRVMTVKNAPMTSHQVKLHSTGWTPVPANRHDGKIMPRGHVGNIERDGQILMERDQRLEAMARQIERQAANAPVIQSRNMAGAMPPSGIADFDHQGARMNTGVKVDRQPRVNDAKYVLEE